MQQIRLYRWFLLRLDQAGNSEELAVWLLMKSDLNAERNWLARSWAQPAPMGMPTWGCLHGDTYAMCLCYEKASKPFPHHRENSSSFYGFDYIILEYHIIYIILRHDVDVRSVRSMSSVVSVASIAGMCATHTHETTLWYLSTQVIIWNIRKIYTLVGTGTCDTVSVE